MDACIDHQSQTPNEYLVIANPKNNERPMML